MSYRKNDIAFDFYYTSIPIGKENAISRKELCNLWGMNDRNVREKIVTLRGIDNGDDYVIVSTSQSSGYFRSSDREDIARFKAETLKRGKRTFMPLRKVSRILAINDDQVRFDNRLKMIRKEKGIIAIDVIREMKSIDFRFDGSILSKIEAGLVMPTPQQLRAFSKLYERSVEELVGITLIESK